MTLKAALLDLPSDRNLVLTSRQVWTRTAILAAPGNLQALKGIKIAICVSDVGLAVQMLAALDGVAELILLLSPDVNANANQALSQQASCQALLTDIPAAKDSSSALPTFHTLEALIAGEGSLKGLAPEDTRWIMSTSGTTATPKLVSHSFGSLSKSTKVNADRGLGQAWGMVYDYTRFAGMQVLLQSILSGAQLIVPDHDNALDDKLSWFAENGCTHLSATPTFWRKILMTPASQKLELQQITMGGEIVDNRILSSVKSRYPAARVVHIFASTEAGVGFSVADGKAGFPESYLTTPPANVEIRVENDRLHVRNLLVKQSYLGEQKQLATEDGWVDTGDAVVICEGRVFFRGRASGVINVGGDKIHPEEVEQVLLSHPDVVAVRVYSKNNPITGALVAADIVLKGAPTDPKAIKNSVKAHAAQKLQRHQVPAFIKTVTSFEMNAAGKLLRRNS